MRDAEKTVGNMIDKEKTIFVGSVDAEGFPNIKAMLQTRKREGLKHIYLSTNTSSMRVSQFLKNNRACLYVCNTRFFKGVMLRGTMEILTDSTSKEMIWQEGDTMYYPEGVTDPDYCVLKFTAFSGRYYSGFKSASRARGQAIFSRIKPSPPGPYIVPELTIRCCCSCKRKATTSELIPEARQSIQTK